MNFAVPFLIIAIFSMSMASIESEISTLDDLEKRIVIDMHAHIAGVGGGKSGCYVSPELKDNWRYHVYLKAFGTTEEELQQKGDSIIFKRLAETLAKSQYVDGAVILALDGVVADDGKLDLSQTEIYIPNDFIASETAKYPNLYFGASINPYRHDALERLKQAKSQGAVLIKWIPSIQKIDPSDKRLKAFYAMLLSMDLPLLVHTGAERSFSKSINELNDPKRLELPLEMGVTVIAAHVATSGKIGKESQHERLIKMFQKYPNLYSDISSLTQINKIRYLSSILNRADFHSRLLYGTDYPLTETGFMGLPLVSPWYTFTRLSWKERRRISQIENPWDRDVTFKYALGFPEKVFTLPAKLLCK